MQLTLQQAATRTGRSRRQVLYAIKKGELKAEKLAGRWFVDSADLALPPAQQQAKQRRQRQLRAAVEDALEVEPEARRFSLRDLKAFRVALPLYQGAGQALGEEHAATQALRRVLLQLARGCHRFERSEKAAAYREARDEASVAACELVLARADAADALLATLEQELMPAFAGLMRRVDRRR